MVTWHSDSIRGPSKVLLLEGAPTEKMKRGIAPDTHVCASVKQHGAISKGQAYGEGNTGVVCCQSKKVDGSSSNSPPSPSRRVHMKAAHSSCNYWRSFL